MKLFTLHIIFLLLPLAGMMAQSCPDTVRLKIMSRFDGPDLTVDILVENFKDIEGFQFGMNYDVDMMRLKLVSSPITSFNADNFSDNKKGNIRFFWLTNNAESLPDGTAILSMKFSAQQISSTGFINISDKQLPLEFVNNKLETLCVETDYKEILSDGYTISGRLIHDKQENCTLDATEKGLSNWMIEMSSLGVKYYRTTSEDGSYAFTVPNGIYTLRVLPRNEYWQICDDVINTFVSGSNVTNQHFFAQEFQPCARIKTDISTASLQRCKDNTYYLIYENQGNIQVDDVNIRVDFDDEYMQFVGSNYPDFTLGAGFVNFDIGTLDINKVDTIAVNLHLLCDNTTDGQTHCVTATATPNDPCIVTPEWSGAKLELEASCDRINNKVKFSIKNNGLGDMKNAKTYIVTEDDVMRPPKTLKLDQFEALDLEFPANGKTYRVMATQDNGFPFESQAITKAIEACGTNFSGNYSKGFVTIFEESDRDVFVDTDCQQSVTVLEENEIVGFPIGYGDTHFINKGTKIDYLVRFDNPGKDTVDNVIVKCKIPYGLDISTLQMGSSSHTYDYRFNQERDLVINFENIQLPDSLASDGNANGYVKFKITPSSALNNGDSIRLQARILYDFNTPVFTKDVFHIIGTDFIISGTEWAAIPLDMGIFPNPTTSEIAIDTREVQFGTGSYDLINQYGQSIVTGELVHGRNGIQCAHLPNGVYHIKIRLDNQHAASVRIIKF